MNVREYLSVRRAYALVRQAEPAQERITFEEFAMLCHLANSSGMLRTSEIASYQGVLRPTMTHRTSHLAKLGLIERVSGESDRRSVCCSLSGEGMSSLERLLAAMCECIKAPMPLSRCKSGRMRRIVDAMGAVSPSSAELVLVCLLDQREGMGPEEEGLAVCDLVSRLGLLQPTVSMAVGSLVESGDVHRVPLRGASRGLGVRLTPAGSERAHAFVGLIEALHVHNSPRTRTS